MSDPIDVAIAAVAQRQHGNITRPQLLGLGLSSSSIAHRVRTVRLIPLYAGVYAVGHAPTTPLARAAAAVLACGEAAALCGDSAVSLWRWRRDWRMPLEVLAPSRHRRAGILVRRSTTLARRDLTTQLGIRVTSPARTILDAAPRQPTSKALARLVITARDSGHLKLSGLAELLVRSAHHPGTKLLAPFVETDLGRLRSALEFEFVAFCERHDLPRPECNVVVDGYEVDAWFPLERVIVELDGATFHHDPLAFEADRERDAHHLSLGIVTVRLTSKRLTAAPAREAARLERILAQRRPRAA